jgi:hypothetical protein
MPVPVIDDGDDDDDDEDEPASEHVGPERVYGLKDFGGCVTHQLEARQHRRPPVPFCLAPACCLPAYLHARHLADAFT